MYDIAPRVPVDGYICFDILKGRKIAFVIHWFIEMSLALHKVHILVVSITGTFDFVLEKRCFL